MMQNPLKHVMPCECASAAMGFGRIKFLISMYASAIIELVYAEHFEYGVSDENYDFFWQREIALTDLTQ